MERSDLTGQRWRRVLSGLTALLVAVALAPALLELHSTGQEHSALDARAEIFTEAVHPTQPAHLEASSSEERDRCTYCVLQLQTAAALRAAPVFAVLVATPIASQPGEPTGAARPRRTLASPRAPPALFAA